MGFSLSYPQKITPDLVIQGFSTSPPAAGVGPSDSYIVIATASGIWVGQENQIATYTGASQEQPWEFRSPRMNERVYDIINEAYWVWNGTAWVGDVTFDALGSSTSIPTSHFAPSTGIAAAGPATFQKGAPIGIYRFSMPAGASNAYSITLNNAAIILDATVYQAANAGGAGCLVDVLTDGPTSVFTTLTCDQTKKAILRADATAAGLVSIPAGGTLSVATTDAGGNLPAVSVVITVALGAI
jgi:hypothetical protein